MNTCDRRNVPPAFSGGTVVPMEAESVAHLLADEWTEKVRPYASVNACILAARTAHEVFGYFGIKHTVQPVMALAVNDRMYDIMVAATERLASFPPDAWSIGVGREVPAQSDNGWSGHLAVITDTHYVDLSAEQFDRPQRQIMSGGPIVARSSEFEFVEAPTFRMWHRPMLKGHYLWMHEDNVTYKGSNDWRLNYKEFTGQIIRSIREKLKASN